MSSSRSIEARLTTWFGLMLFTGYVLFAIALWLSVRLAVAEAVDATLEKRIERLVATVEADVDGPEEVSEDLVELLLAAPEGELARILDGEGRQIYPPENAPSFRDVKTLSSDYRTLTRAVTILDERYEVTLVSSLESLDRAAASLLATVAVLAPMALVLSTLGGLAIARRALAPVDAITEAASNVTVRNLEDRLAVPDSGDALERLSRTFNEMLERLETSVRRIEQFTGDASHELRTPISVIRTTAELALRQGRTPDECRKDLEAILFEARALGELVDVLLTLSRDGFDENDVRMAPVDLAAIVTLFCDRARPTAEGKGLALELALELMTSETPLAVMGNEAALRTLVGALVTNAIEHTSSGAVQVRVSGGTRTVELEVRDTGEGIPEDALPHIFERFYRVDAARARTEGGAHFGLGLAIARRVAELHRAKISVASRLGMGSTFTVVFPRPGGEL